MGITTRVATMKPRKPAPFSLPKNVLVAGHTVTVKVTSDISELGNFDLDTLTICIRQDVVSTPALAMDTLRHELMHAALRIGGIGFVLTEGVEEGVVRSLEQLFIPAWNRVVESTIVPPNT